MERVIAHVDMDAFFAAVEELCRPSLRGRPLLVCGDPDGRSVVSTASYAARRYGVRSGMPVREALKRCPGAVLVPVDGTKYAAASARVYQILQRFSPRVEMASIDEAFLDFSSVPQPLAAAGAMKLAVCRETGLPCSVGVGENKLLAKLGSELRKPDGFSVLTAARFPALFHGRPVEVLPGIGAATAAKLAALGVHTVGELAACSRSHLEQRFGLIGRILHALARGRDDSPVRTREELPAEKSVGHEHTLNRDEVDPGRLRCVLLELCDRVAERMRRRNLEGRTLTCKLRFSDFRTITRARTPPSPFHLPQELFALAASLLQANQGGRALRLLGVSVSGVRPRGGAQLELFPVPGQGGDALWRSLDRISDQFGRGTVRRASCLAIRTPGL